MFQSSRKSRIIPIDSSSSPNGDKVSKFSELTSEQIRQTIDTEQVFDEWCRVSKDFERRFRGAMSWKTVSGRDYLYRKTGAAWKSLGPRSDETEQSYRQFHDGRQECRERLAVLATRLDELAAVNRAMRLGRVPLLTARLLRNLDKSGLMGTAFDVVGTNALYAYERLAGVRIDSGLIATGDIDLMFDARSTLRLFGGPDKPASLLAMLQQVDRSFELIAKSSFRAANKDGFLVDLIMPAAKNRWKSNERSGLATSDDDLVAVEIEGLQWLVNSPKIEAMQIDDRGYPVRFSCPDPRSFAAHKQWLSKRGDRDTLKRDRDRQQALLVRQIVAERLLHLRFDDPVLGAIPKALLDEAESSQGAAPRLEPDW
jgi:hypothetical protein